MHAAIAHEALPVPVRSALWFGHQLGAAEVPTVPSGFPGLDAELPGGGWPLAGLTELLQEVGPGGGELALLAGAQARAAAQGGEVVWIAPPHTPFAPALHALGVPLERFLWLAPADPKDAAWAAEQVLRSGTCAWVQWWSPCTAPEVLRRLHKRVGDRLVLVSVGGVSGAEDVYERLSAGATLVQAYTGFVYGGPLWPSRINRELARLLREDP